MTVKFEEIPFLWRGPSPFVFVAVPEPVAAEIRAMARQLSYGWGVIPVQVRLGGTVWGTSLFHKDGRYLVPVKQKVREAESVELGKPVVLEVSLG